MDKDQAITVKWLSGISALVGAWLVISPFTLHIASASVYWNQIVIGVLALALGLTQLSAPRSSWASWVNLIAALWLLASPYMFMPAETIAYTNAVISGLILGALALSDGLIAEDVPRSTSSNRRMA